MTSTELITELKRVAPSWTRPNLLNVVNTVQNMIFAEPLPMMRIENDGEDTVITTVSGQREYELSAISSEYDGAYDAFLVTEIRSYAQGDITSSLTNTPTATFIPAFGSNSAKVYLDFDPETGDKYYVKTYRRPAQLTVESIPISVPNEYITSVLFEGACGRIEQFEHGNSNRYEKFLTDLMPKLIEKLKGKASEDAVIGGSKLSALISRLRRKFPDISRENLIVEVNAAQDAILAKEFSFLRQQDSVGKDYILTATAGQRRYELTSGETGWTGGNTWRVSKLVYHTGGLNPVATDKFFDSTTVRLVKANGTSNAQVIFNFDPSGGEQFYVESYLKYPPILDEGSVVTLPEEFILSHLYEITVAQLEYYTNGQTTRYQNAIKELLPQLREELSSDVNEQLVGDNSTVVSDLFDSLMDARPDLDVTKLVKYVNAVQGVILAKNPSLSKVISCETGKDPILKTVDGKYVYELSIDKGFYADVKTVMKVSSVDGSVMYMGDKDNDTATITVINASGGTKAKIAFDFNPEGKEFFVECYKYTPRIANRNSDLSIPYEYASTYLLEGTLAYIKKIINNSPEEYELFKQQSLPSLQKMLESNSVNHTIGELGAVSLLIDRLKIEFPKWERSELLKEINIVQRQIFSFTGQSNRIVDSATGKDPVLTTESGVFEYELSATSTFGFDVLRITSVAPVGCDQGYNEYNKPQETYIQGISTKKAVGGSKAKVLFNFDPGVADYTVKCYGAQALLENEHDELGIPEEFIYPYIYEGVAGKLVLYKKGGSRRYDDFNNYLLRELLYKLDLEQNSNVVYIEPRGI